MRPSPDWSAPANSESIPPPASADSSSRSENRELDPAAVRTRDGRLASALAGTTFLFAIVIWSLELYPDPFPYLFLTPASCSGSAPYFVAGWVVVAAASAMFGLTHFLPQSQLGRMWKSVVQQGLLAPLFMLAAGSIAILWRFGVVPDCVSLRYGLISLGALTLAGLYFGRGTQDIRPALVVGLWAALLLLAVSTLRRLGAVIAFERASWLSRGAIVTYSAAAYALAAGPVLAMAPGGRRTLEGGIRRVARLPRHVHGVVLAAALFAHAISRTGAVADLRFEVLLRSLGALALLSLACLLLADPGGPTDLVPQEPAGRSIRWMTVLPAALFVLLLYRVAQGQLYDLDPDSYSYLSIARHYAEGEPAVRGYWSPLLSWLTAAPIMGGVDPIFAGRLVQGAAALAWLILALRLAAAWGLSRASQVAFAGALAGVAALHAFRHFVPDLLGAAALLPLFALLTAPHLGRRPAFHGFLLGPLAALAYYAKYYNLIFAVALVGLTAALRRRSFGDGRRVGRFLAAGLATLAVLVVPWVVAISARYGYGTISTSGEIGRTVAGPHVPTKHPCIYVQLCRTPDDVLFPWEDPRLEDYTAYVWSPWENLANLRHQLVLPIWALDRISSQVVDLYGPLPLLAFGVQGGAAVLFPANHGRRQSRRWALGAISLFCAGYLILGNHVNRYFLPVMPLVLIVLFALAERFAAALAGSAGTARTIGASVLRTMVPLACVVSLLPGRQIAELAARAPGTDCLAQAASVVEPFLAAPMAGVGNNTYFLSYYSRVRTYGSLSLETPPHEVGERLEELGVETVLVPLGSPTSVVLQKVFGYSSVLRFDLCQTAYEVLRRSSPVAGQDVLLSPAPKEDGVA